MKADLSWINDDLLDALKMTESSGKNFQEDGSLTVNPVSGALGAYQIMPANFGYLELDPENNPGVFSDTLGAAGYGTKYIDRELLKDEAYAREWARSYLEGMQRQYPHLSQIDILRAYNAGPGTVKNFYDIEDKNKQRLPEKEFFTAEALAYPNKVFSYLPKAGGEPSPVVVEEPVIQTAEASPEVKVEERGPLSNNPIITSMDYFNNYASPTYDLNFLSDKLRNNFQKIRTEFVNLTMNNNDYSYMSEEQKRNMWRNFLQMKIDQGEIQAEAAMKLDSGDIVGIGANRGLSSVPNINSMEVPPMYYARGTDTVPAMLTPGEAVIPREAAQHPAYKPIIQEMISTGRQMQDVMDDGGMFNMAAWTENPYGWSSDSYEADYYNSKVLGSPRPELGYWYAPGHYNQGTDDVGKRMIDQWINAAKMTRINRDEGPFPMDITGEAWKEFEEPVDPYANTLLDSGKVKKDHEAMLARERALARRNTPGSPIAKFGPGPLGNRVPKLDDIGVPVSNMTTKANEIKMRPDFAPFIEGNIAPQDEFGVPLSDAVTTPIEQEAGPSMPPFLEHPSLKEEGKEGYEPAFDLDEEYTGPYKKDPLRNVKWIYNGLSWLFGGTWNDNWGNKKKKEEAAKVEKALAEGFVPREYTEERLRGQVPPPSDYFSTNVEGEFPIIDDDTGIKAGFNEEDGTVELTSTQPLYNKDENINLPSQETLDAVFKNNGNTPTGIFKWIEDNLGFTKQDALRALVFYAGGRLAGGSHKGSLQWAGKRVLQEYDDRMKTQAALKKAGMTEGSQQLTFLKDLAKRRLDSNLYTVEGAKAIRDALTTMDPTVIHAAISNPSYINPAAEAMDLSKPLSVVRKGGIEEETIYKGWDNRNYYKLTDSGYEPVSRVDYTAFKPDIRDNQFRKVLTMWNEWKNAGKDKDQKTIPGSTLSKLEKNFGIRSFNDFDSVIDAYANRRNIDELTLSRRINDILNLISPDSVKKTSLEGALSMLEITEGETPDLGKLEGITNPIIQDALKVFKGRGNLSKALQLTDQALEREGVTASTIDENKLMETVVAANPPNEIMNRIQQMPNNYWKYFYLYAWQNNIIPEKEKE